MKASRMTIWLCYILLLISTSCCQPRVTATLNILNNPTLFELILDKQVFGVNFEQLSTKYIDIQIEELKGNNYFSYNLIPNTKSSQYSFYIQMQYKQSTRILDSMSLTMQLTIPQSFLQQGYMVEPSGFNFQLHKYQNICDSDQYYNSQTNNCEQKIMIISRLFVTEDNHILQLALNQLDFQYFAMIKDFTKIQIQNMHSDNFSFTIEENFFQIKNGKINTPEDFQQSIDNYNDFNIQLNYTDNIIYQKPLITIDFTQFPDYMKTNSKYSLKKSICINVLTDNFQLSDANSRLIDGFSETMAILNNIVEFLAIICILGYPYQVFVFVLLLSLKYPLMLKFMDIDYPPNIHEFYQHEYAFETKWLYFYKFKRNNLRNMKLVTDNFELYKISPYFLDNVGDKIARLLIILIVCGIIHLLNRKLEKKQLQNPKSKFKKFLEYFIAVYSVSLPMSLFLSYFFELCFFTWCSFQFAAIYSIQGVINIIFSIICFFVISWILLYFYKIQVLQIQTYKKVSMRIDNVKKGSTMILDDQSELMSPECQKLFQSFFFLVPPKKGFNQFQNETLAIVESNKYYIFQHDFANNTNFFTQYYIFILAIKYFVLSFILALFHEFLAFQMTLQCLIIIIFVILTIKYKPYNLNTSNVFSMSIDILIFLYQILQIVIIILDKIENPIDRNIDYRLAFGWIFITFYFLQLLFVLIIFLYFTTKLAISLIKQVRQRNLDKQINNNTNENAQQETKQIENYETKNQKKFQPINFQVNHSTDKNKFINMDNSNQSPLKNQTTFMTSNNTQGSPLKPNQQNFANTMSPEKNQMLTSLQMKYLADKIKARQEQQKKLNQQNIDIKEQSFELQEVDEIDMPSSDRQNDQSNISPIQSNQHFDSPLLKKAQEW